VKPKLLLHVCCGPCSTEVIKQLKSDYEVVGFFYNPNISPEAEYFRRLAEVQRVSALWRLLVDTGEYEHGRFLAVADGLEHEPEGGLRCEACYRLRLDETARRAAANGCTVVASTLTIGRNKKAAVVNRVGRDACAKLGLEFLEADWKKKDGNLRSIELSRELGLYRQEYCGCEFSGRPGPPGRLRTGP
jgi:epoxyqueuosine reductase